MSFLCLFSRWKSEVVCGFFNHEVEVVQLELWL